MEELHRGRGISMDVRVRASRFRRKAIRRIDMRRSGVGRWSRDSRYNKGLDLCSETRLVRRGTVDFYVQILSQKGRYICYRLIERA